MTVPTWLLVLLVVGSGGHLSDGAWVTMSAPPTETDLDCAGYDHVHQWEVTIRNGVPWVSIQQFGEHADPLPFAVPRAKDRVGDRHVLKVPGGWLIGFDAGEFGGGLWFTDAARWHRLRPPADAPAKADDPFKAENVLAVISVEGSTLVLMGLDHLTGRSGRVFTVVSGADGYRLGPGAALDSSPEAWVVVGEDVEVVTGGGLWRVTPAGKAQRIVPIDFGVAYPSSLAVAPDGRRYIGMRRYVLALEPSTPAWRQTWYGPAGCAHSGRDERWRCSCLN